MHPYNCECAACEISRIDDGYGAAARRGGASAPAYRPAVASRPTITARPAGGSGILDRVGSPRTSGGSGGGILDRVGSPRIATSTTASTTATASRRATVSSTPSRAPTQRFAASSPARTSAASVAAAQQQVAEVAATGEGQKKNWLTQSLRLNRSKIKPALSVKQVGTGASAYFRPEVPQEVQEAIPNYYAQTRKDRQLSEIPAEASGSDHEIAKYIVENLAQDPDRRNTVEETIYVVLILSSQQALQSGDFASAKTLMDTAQKWAETLSRAAKAQQGGGLSGFLGDLSAAADTVMDEKGTLIVVGSFFLAGLALMAYSQKKGKRK